MFDYELLSHSNSLIECDIVRYLKCFFIGDTLIETSFNRLAIMKICAPLAQRGQWPGMGTANLCGEH